MREGRWSLTRRREVEHEGVLAVERDDCVVMSPRCFTSAVPGPQISAAEHRYLGPGRAREGAVVCAVVSLHSQELLMLNFPPNRDDPSLIDCARAA